MQILMLGQGAPAALGCMCIGMVLGLAIGLAIGAVILRAAVKFVVKYDLPWWPAVGIVALNAVIGWVLGIVIGLPIGLMVGKSGGAGKSAETMAQVLAMGISFPIQFVVTSFIYGLLIKAPKVGGVSRLPMHAGTPYESAAEASTLEYQSPSMVRPEPIGFVKGMLVHLVALAIVIAIAIVIGVIVFGVMFASGTRF